MHCLELYLSICHFVLNEYFLLRVFSVHIDKLEEDIRPLPLRPWLVGRTFSFL